MTERRPVDPAATLRQRVTRLRLWARAVLLFERVWPEIWPPLGLLGVFLCVALLDLPRTLPAALHIVVLVIAVAAFAWLLRRALRAVRLPDDRDADRRLELASGLRHRPLSVLSDRPALPGSDALWRAHVARAAAQVGRLRIGIPRPGLAARDPRALRAALLVGLAACLVIAGEQGPARVARALIPTFVPPTPPTPTEVQGWITPPGYTNLAPAFLRPEGGAVSVPAGSHLTVSLSGGTGVPTLTLAGQPLAFQGLDPSGFQADQDLAEGGRLVVARNGQPIVGWDVAVVADVAPVVLWPEPPGAAKGGGRVPQTRLPYQVSHDYGVVALQAELRLKNRPEAPPLVVQIPLPGGAPKTAKGARLQDLTSHPWAGVPVTARLVARDAPGLTGTSEPADFKLPERRFDNATARALLAVRRSLTLRPTERSPAIGELDTIAGLDDWQNDPGGFLNLRAVTAELARNHDPGAIEEAQSRLWQLALHLEEGGADRTSRALAEARQALRDAVDAQKRGDKVDPGEIDKRIEALEKAIEQHLEALAEQLQRDPDAAMNDPEARQLDAQDAHKLAEELREMEKQGKSQDAEKKLAELEKMLDQLQKAKPQHRDAQQKERQQKRQKGQQQMNALQDMVKREGGLLDHAQARDAAVSPYADPARRARQGTPAESQAPQTGAVPPDAARDDERRTDGRVQQALRRALGELMQQSGELLGKVPPNLGDADIAMHDAVQALDQGHDGPAATSVQKAIEALQKGGKSMSEQMAQQFGSPGDQSGEEQAGQEEPGDEPGDDQGGPGVSLGDSPQDNQSQGQGKGHGARPRHSPPGPGRRADHRLDPLGRPLKDDGAGSSESADVALPEEMEQARTRAIQDELRRRGGDRGRPQPELDYIDRLLKQF